MGQYTYDDVKSMVMMLLRKKDTVTADDIKSEIDILLKAYAAADLIENIDPDALFRDISSRINVWQEDPSVLRDRKHVNWLPQRKAEIRWGFWKRYRQYLEEEKNWSPNITSRLDATTDMILGDLGNPAQSGAWDRRGMVVGDVQSGKTANYTGLICKAVDAGYKLVIVLAGMTNDLRSQTQARLDAEFLGFESELGKLHENSSRIGVGRIEDHGQLIAQPLTASGKDGDFRSKKSANLQLGGSPLLLVVKKHASVLGRILKWVESQGAPVPGTDEKIVGEVPLLLLDDEADNASVNTKSADEDPTSINRVIRKILKTFSESSYVGYTATPFANIFIMPDEEDTSVYGKDLFPKNFIYYITPPDNYIGAAQIFGLAEDIDGISGEDHYLPLIRYTEDAAAVVPPRHKKEHSVSALPESMLEAIRAFIIVCAARAVRGQHNAHNSMLIHVTRYNRVQAQVLDLVKNELSNMQRMLEYETGKQAKGLVGTMEALWYKDFVPTTETVAGITKDLALTKMQWEDVQRKLYECGAKIQVRGINGDMAEVLDYAENPAGLSVIAIGGDKLSRGLTLEGLSVSYYTRPAYNYDTLLQMGRWFGYRPGYLDLCRLYTTEELVGWYQHIAMANEELKREFRLMELSKLTPDDYGLKVRTHPRGLSITAANKIRSGRSMQVSFSGHLAQTTVFQKDEKVQKHNYEHTEQWIRRLGSPDPERKRNNYIWKGISAEAVKSFLRDFETAPIAGRAETDLLIKYIEKLNAYGELTDWTVALVNSGSKSGRQCEFAGYHIVLTKRTDSSSDSDLYMLRNSNIISPGDQFIDLLEDEFRDALRKTIDAWSEGRTRLKEQPKAPTGPFIRAARSPSRGLLLVYPLEPVDIRTNEEEQIEGPPVIGFAISFPDGSRNESVEYKVNTRYWNDRYGDEEDEDV